MPFGIEFTEDALEDLRALRKHEQALIVDRVERLVPLEPARQTRNRKPLRPNDLGAWALRMGKYRVFYDVPLESHIVTIKAVGRKEHDRLFVRGQEFRL